LFTRRPFGKRFNPSSLRRVSYWVTKSEKLIRKTLTMSAEEQKREIEAAGETPIFSYNQTDFVRIELPLRFRLASTPLLPTISSSSTSPSM
jgi:hypothetical protein